MSVDLGQFHASFFEEMQEHLDTIERLLLGAHAEEAQDSESLNAIFRAAHSIKGGAATFGFQDIAELTHVLENMLDRIRRGELALSESRISASLSTHDALAAMLAAHQHGHAGIDPALVQQQIAELTRLAQEDASPSTGPVSGKKAAEWLLRVSLSEASRVPAAIESLQAWATISPAGEQDGQRLFRLDSQLGANELAESLAFCLPPHAFQLESLACHVEDGVGLFESSPPVLAEAESASRAEETAGWGLFPPVATPVAQEEKAPAPPEKNTQERLAETSIRVNVDKIDQLLNRIGELVITHSMLAEQVSRLGGAVPDGLSRGMLQLERNTRELQETVMSVRMMPIAAVFGRFPRLVRDLGHKLGKQVELSVIGEQTEIDKGFVEKLTDPLTHLVRNSLDHGIEAAEIREAAGKPSSGRLTLRACHQGGNIVIEVCDDGAGLNRDRILAKARERNLPVNDGMSDAEVWLLIFEPGFSTASQISDLSGRGVGMDVVRRNIEAMGGVIRIESIAGVGTTISLHLPLTLAILDGMSIMVGEEIYVLPLSQVVESLQPQEGDVLSLAGACRVLRVRDEYLPLLALWEIFDIPPRVRLPGQGLAIIVAVGGQRAALLVDDLVCQQQFVVKNLESNYRRVRGLAAATILGDGRVAFILDCADVLRLGMEN